MENVFEAAKICIEDGVFLLKELFNEKKEIIKQD